MHKAMTKIGMMLLILFLSWGPLSAGTNMDRGAFEKARMEASEQGKLLLSTSMPLGVIRANGWTIIRSRTRRL